MSDQQTQSPAIAYIEERIASERRNFLKAIKEAAKILDNPRDIGLIENPDLARDIPFFNGLESALEELTRATKIQRTLIVLKEVAGRVEMREGK